MNLRGWIWQAGLGARASKWQEGTGYFTLGRATFDFSRLKSVVRRRGYLMPFDPVLARGGGGYARRGKLLVGGSGQGGGGALEDEQHRTVYGYGNGALTYGYVVHETKRIRLFPYVGVGGMGAGLSVKPHDSAFVPGRHPSAGAGGPVLTIGWALEYRVPLLPRRFLVLGLHAGMLITPVRLGWWGRRVDDKRLPQSRLVKPYFKLLIGASWSQ